MARYAEKTKAPVMQSISEIKKTVERYNADGFTFAMDGARAGIGFRIDNRMVRFMMTLPDDEQGTRQIWRAMLLTVKSKLECVESGIETFEEAFLAHIVVPGRGATFGQLMIPELTRAIETGEMPKLLE
ncbi:MAG: hypothetical protein V3V24_09840 [Nitrospinaceae bacterium]